MKFYNCARASWVAFLVTTLTVAAILPVQAEDPAMIELINRLQQRIDQLERKVQMLEASNAATSASVAQIQVPATETATTNAGVLANHAGGGTNVVQWPKIVLGDKGFLFSSADDQFSLSVRGLLQVDSRTYFDDAGAQGNDSMLLRRARPLITGTAFHDFDFMFAPEFGGSSVAVYDAYLNYRYKPALQFRTGKFKSPIGLEYLEADQYTFFNERALPTTLVPGRDVGSMVHGDVADGVFSYAVGLFNGLGNGRNSENSDFDDSKAVEGRFFLLPFKSSELGAVKGLGFGVGGSYESLDKDDALGLPSKTGGSTPGYATTGLQQYFGYNSDVVASGEHWRLAPQSYYVVGPISLLSEFHISEQEVMSTGADVSDSLRHQAWQVAVGWIVTGEKAVFNEAIVPRKPFNPRQGHWGALQLVARYAEMRLDDNAFPVYANPDISARSISEWAIGFNWWLNRNIRIASSFSHASFNGGGGSGSNTPATVTREGENVLFTRVQLSF